MVPPMQVLTVAGVPVLCAQPSAAGTALPLVLWFHGFRADALAHAAELERCAEAGFLAVGVDAVGHGRRLDPALGARIADRGGALPVMLELVRQSCDELPALVAELAECHGADASRVSLVGISMGAFLAYRAMADVGVGGLPLRSVVALLGDPSYAMAVANAQQVSVRGIALLSITAEHDVSVPPAPARALHAALAMTCGDAAHHRHHELRGAGHLTNAAQWKEAMHETLHWLEMHGR